MRELARNCLEPPYGLGNLEDDTPAGWWRWRWSALSLGHDAAMMELVYDQYVMQQDSLM
jgi:hypothetical protein